LTGYHVINLQKFMLHQYDHLHTLSNTNLELQGMFLYCNFSVMVVITVNPKIFGGLCM
ncbi:unnamed protein product, partial [Brassica rapa]